MQSRYTYPPKNGSPNDIDIVGIVNTHRHDVQEDVASTGRLFVPFAQGYTGNVFFHVRLGSQDRQSGAGMIGTVRSTLRDIDPDLLIINIARYVDLLDRCVGLWIGKSVATLFVA